MLGVGRGGIQQEPVIRRVRMYVNSYTYRILDLLGPCQIFLGLWSDLLGPCWTFLGPWLDIYKSQGTHYDFRHFGPLRIPGDR
jgi:hypothetical protein